MSVLLLLFSALLVFSPEEQSPSQNSRPQFGTQDFGVYWIASRLFKGGQNPYEAGTFLEMTRKLELYQDDRYLYFAPPWVLTILAPVTTEDFDFSVHLWIALNAILALGCGFLVARIYARDPVPPLLWIGGVVTFFPLLKNLQTGNLGILILSGVLVIHLAFKRGQNFIAGVFMAMLLIKPHLTYLYTAALGIRILFERRFTAVTGFLGSFGTILLGTYVINPNSFDQWLSLLSAPGDALAWRTPTIATFAREGLLHFTGRLAGWPGFAISALALLLLGAWLARKKLAVSWDEAMPALLAVSLVTAPYSWSTDHCILLPIQCAALILGRESSRPDLRRAIAFLASIQIAQVFLYTLMPEEYSVIFPLLFIAIWSACLRHVHSANAELAAK